FVAVAAADHPLNQADSLTHEDLRQHRQIVIRDSGSRRIDSGWLGAEQRWTVSHPST
ncbi:MAG TPA: LysR family transcriptional regulator, partial [Alcanivorax sp.]|nr:LysR family transcriptional regulator [Alcanivorax sp.]